MANHLLAIRKPSHTNHPPRVGKNWVSNLVARRPELQCRFSRRYNHDRAKCEDRRIVEDWFKTLERVMTEHGIVFEDIYNFDEAGFAMGLCATTKVITSAEHYGRATLIQPGNREWVTAIESVNASGWAPPPYIILKGHNIQEGWFDGLPEGWRLDVSPNGWTTDEIGIKWLTRLFIPAANPRRVGTHILLILDGHGSHLTPEFDQICSENKIIPLCMPPHSSHLLQPLDVGVFAPLKRAYGTLVEQRMRLGFNIIKKADFLDAYPAARREAFKASNIQSGFRATGIVPLDPQGVVQQLNIQLRTPTPPASRSSNSTSSWILQTPSNPRQLQKQVNKVRNLMDQDQPHGLVEGFDQIIKACEYGMVSAMVMKKQYEDIFNANEKEKQKRKRVPQSFPPITEQESGSEAEGDQTEYAMAEEDMTTSGSARDTGKMPEREESEDGTPSPMPIPTPNPNGMVTMAAADLIALCERLISARAPPPPPPPNPIPEEDPNMLAREYQKEAQASLNTKSVTTFDGTNYQTWKMAFLSDAEVIGGADILNKNQQEPPEGLSSLDQRYWVIRSKLLFRRMLQSLVGSVRLTMGSIQPDNAAALWNKDGDYLAYVRRYQYLSARMRQLTEDRGENYLHDFFIIGLRDYQRTYVKSRLDTFYGTGQGPIVNLDINDLTKQIAHRMSKSEGTGRPKAPKANAATNDNDNTTSAATAKCGYCKVPGHIKANCYHLNPDKAPEWWRKENKDNKGTDNTEGAKKKGKDKKKDKDDDKPTGTRAPDLLASQPNANAAIALSTSSATTSKPWYLDTCASFNMTGERHSLVRAKSFEGDLEITTADGGVGRVEEIGDILLESEGGDISVGYVHWIPNLTVNLLSFAKLEDQGFRYQLSDTTPSYFTIRAPNGANFTAVRTSKESVYKIIERESQIDVHHPSQAVHFMAKSYNYGDAMSTIAGKPNDQPSDRNPLTRTLMEWHVTLGHIHAGAIIALAKDPSSGIRIINHPTVSAYLSCG
ncbi:conserved hypothetical protein [Histoplasma mississippiense (nom. inval.)]|uniref:conserved hypothetical protein n=1 Tax=Ajellomyces capsulatus (strain NAm1 / WU24) TaxID=2059318 RepID=UPI000157C79C|nr:conserved hypothetical protein [Histoplasma mississippiense (nom. inval.)]EDN08447.1 conserved hypothetical protein [Histoplasma mississippiense (nom. inval.)]